MSSIKLSWTDLKAYVDAKSLNIQYFVRKDDYHVFAIYGGVEFYTDIFIDTPASTDQSDFEDNYKNGANKPVEISIQEEIIKTGGHYQAMSFELDVPATTGDHSKTFSWPIPVSIMAAEFVMITSMDGDEVEFMIGENTVIGTLTADEASSQTELSVSQTVIDNIFVGAYVSVTDGTNTDDCGRCLSIDEDNNTITVETALTNSYLAVTPTYVRMTVKMVPKVHLPREGRYQLGECKVGGSYIPANTDLKMLYTNNTGTAKKFRWVIEYLY